jgi:RNA polymerase sigma-70 factor, ECF subfamily
MGVNTLVGSERSATQLPGSFRGSVKFVTFDQEYVRLLTAGDPETEQHFVSYFGSLMRIKLRSRLRSPQLAEEVQQETFLRVLATLRRKGGLQNPERLGAFVNTVCNNVYLESIRAETRTNPYPQEDFDTPDTRVDVEGEFVTWETRKQVETVLAGLPAKSRDLLRMIFLEERDKAEVCRELNVEPGYLRVLIHRAKSCFRIGYEKDQVESFTEKTVDGNYDEHQG